MVKQTDMPALPSINTLVRYGKEMEKEFHVFYIEGGMYCVHGMRAIYELEFATAHHLSVPEMRAVGLQLVDSFVQKLSQDPGIRARLKNAPNMTEGIRKAIVVYLHIGEKKQIFAKDPQRYTCVFSGDAFRYMGRDKKNGTSSQVITEESYDEAKARFNESPTIPVLTLALESPTEA